MDRIVYICTTKPGGIDGMDHTDKGGGIMFASFDPAAAESYLKKDHWSQMHKEILDDKQAVHAALKKLTPVDLLFIQPQPIVPVPKKASVREKAR